MFIIVLILVTYFPWFVNIIPRLFGAFANLSALVKIYPQVYLV
ncbi:MAG: hypothetical protein R2865_04365 [Deinococcales bacterium]